MTATIDLPDKIRDAVPEAAPQRRAGVGKAGRRIRLYFFVAGLKSDLCFFWIFCDFWVILGGFLGVFLVFFLKFWGILGDFWIFWVVFG
jgi:hypothetical protein